MPGIDMIDEIRKFNECRLGYYRLASMLFLEPSSELLRDAASVIKAIMDAGCGGLGRDTLESLRSAIEDSMGGVEELKVEHTRLFVNAYPRLECPPYETVYREKRRSLMGRHALDMAAFLEEIGLEPSESFKEPPEHIAVEMEAMFYLIYRWLREKGGMADLCPQWKLYKSHLAAWIPEYASCLEKAARHPLYVSLAMLLKELIVQEERFFEGLEEVCER